MTDYPVDIVIPWVDGSDPAWIREHDKYTANSLQDNSSARYREWDLFRFWFRSIEENAPWVNRGICRPGSTRSIRSCMSCGMRSSSRRSICPPSVPTPSS